MNNFAISSGGIGEALQRSASALAAAGNTLDESIGLITAANTVVQDPESVGTALKTLSMRLRGTKVELEAAGEDTDGMAESVSTLQAKLKALSHGKVDIMENANEFKSTTEILREMADAWDYMTDTEQAAALELMGGKRQANILSAIIENYDVVEDAINSSETSSGSALIENEKYLDSIQGKIDILTNSVQQMWSDFINADAVKFVVELANGFVKLVDKIGLGKTALFGILEYLTLIKKVDFTSLFKSAVSSIKTNGLASLFTGASTGTSSINLLGGAELEAEIQKMNSAISGGTATWEAYKAGVKNANNGLYQYALQLERNVTVNNGATASTQGYTVALSSTTNALNMAAIKQAALNTVISISITGIIVLISSLISKISSLENNSENSFDSLQTSISETKNTISDLEDEISSLKSQIDDISGTTLSFSDSEELKRLQAESKELERQKDLQEAILNAQTTTNNASSTQLLQDTFKNQTYGQQKDKEVTKLVGSIGGLATGALAALAILAAIPTGGLSLGAGAAIVGAGGLIGTGAGYLAGTSIGNQAYSDTTYNAVDWYNSYNDALIKAQNEADEAESKYLQTMSDNDYETWKAKEEKVTDIQEELYSNLDTLQQYVANTEYNEDTKEILDNYNLMLDKFAIDQNSQNAKVNFLDRIFGDNATVAIKKAKEDIQEIVDDTTLTSEDKATQIEGVLNRSGSSFDTLKENLNDVGVQIEEVIDYFMQLGDYAQSSVSSFSIDDYISDNTDSIDTVQSKISSFESALDSFESGSFTISDLIDLMQEFPDYADDIADGITLNDGKVQGLTKNLIKLDKASANNLVKSLKQLRQQLVNAGKSTSNIDQLIDAMNGLTTDHIDDLIDKYGILTDSIEDATSAQNDLSDAMDNDTNSNYVTTVEAIQDIESLMEQGAYGADAKMWDEWKVLAGDNAEMMQAYIDRDEEYVNQWLQIHEKYYQLDDDDNGYNYAPVEQLLTDLVSINDQLAQYGAHVEYANGTLSELTIPDEYMSDIAHLLDLSTDQFLILLQEVGQFHDIQWTTADDFANSLANVTEQINEIASDKSLNAAERLEKINRAMQGAVGSTSINGGDVDLTSRPEVSASDMRAAGWDVEDDGSVATVYSNTFYKSDFGDIGVGEQDAAIVVTPILPDGSVLSPDELAQYAEQLLNGEQIDIGDGITLGLFEGDGFKEKADAFAEYLHEIQAIWMEVYDETQVNPLSLNFDNLEQLVSQLQSYGVDSTLINGELTINIPEMEEVLHDHGYDDDTIATIFESLSKSAGIIFDGLNTDTETFVANMQSISQIDVIDNLAATEDALRDLGIAYNEITDADGYVSLEIDQSAVDTLFATLNLTEDRINQIKQEWEDQGITITSNFDATGTTNAQNAESEVKDKNVEITVTDNASPVISQVNNELENLHDKDIKITTHYNSVYTTTWGGITVGGSGSAHANGTGESGAGKTETSLVGELGPEMRVRDGQWSLLGENGAEFTDIKKGDIIFSAKQTKSLLENGYITSRGKAFAEGTAYLSGSGTHRTYYYASSNSDADSSDSDSDDSKQTIDFIQYKIENIENLITNITDKIENFLDDTSNTIQKNAQYDAEVEAEKEKAQTYLDAANLYSEKAKDLLEEIPAEYRDMAQNGAIAIYDFLGEDEADNAEAIENYREMLQNQYDAENSYLESIAQISADRLEQLQDIADDFENISNLIDSQSDLLQAGMDLVTESGERLSSEYYQELIKSTKDKKSGLEQEKNELQSILDNAVTNGEVQVGSDDWYEMVNAIYDVDQSIIECDKDVETFQNDINDLEWDNFDKFITQLTNLDNQLSHLYDLLSDEEDIVDDEGNWTDKGITSMGLLAQQMENAQYQAEQYGKAIEKLKQDYKDGKYSTDEYNDKLAELQENQWSSVEAYEAAKDSLVSLNKTRVDAAKNAMQEEIDAYQELIDKKKESLEADKDAHDFEEEIAEKQKDIATIQKQIAAIQNDSSAEAAAKRKQLHADLLEAQADLEDTYYDHSVDTQEEALDDEYDNFEKAKQDEMDALDEWLENEEQVISESLAKVQENADVVLQTILTTAQTYGVDISDAIIEPWENGESAITSYSGSFTSLNSAFASALNTINESQKTLVDGASSNAQKMIDDYKKAAEEIEAAYQQISSIPTEVSNSGSIVSVGSSSSSSSSSGSSSGSSSYSGGSTSYYDSNVAELQQYLNSLGYSVSVDGIYGNQTAQALSSAKTNAKNQADGIKRTMDAGNTSQYNQTMYRHWTSVYQKLCSYGYAKGTTGVLEDQLALIDELGEELVLHAGKNGKIEYLTKGTGVIPNDLTERLMDIAMDPTSVLENSRPSVSAPQLTNNNFELNLEFGSLVHVDTCNEDTIPTLQKMVKNEFDSMMKQLNNRLYSKVR